jgi:carboxymethylenebutenolidase
MGEFQTLMARDGHEFRSYISAPQGTPRAAIVVVQEIFGVNRHIRAVTDDFASQGYVAIAPSMFDRIRKGIELGYSEADIQTGRGYAMQLEQDKVLKDLSAAIAVVKHAGRVGVVGYCWGGSVAYLAACELPIACAVSYYGTRILQMLEKKPKRPVMYHFGERDKSTPPEAIERIRAAHPEGVFHVYPAGHGFNCTERADYEPQSAALARERTLEFFARYLEPQPKQMEDEE